LVHGGGGGAASLFFGACKDKGAMKLPLRSVRGTFQILLILAVLVGIFSRNFLLFFMAVALGIIAFVFERVRQKAVVLVEDQDQTEDDDRDQDQTEDEDQDQDEVPVPVPVSTSAPVPTPVPTPVPDNVRTLAMAPIPTSQAALGRMHTRQTAAAVAHCRTVDQVAAARAAARDQLIAQFPKPAEGRWLTPPVGTPGGGLGLTGFSAPPDCWWSQARMLTPMSQRVASEKASRDCLTRAYTSADRDRWERMVVESFALRKPANSRLRVSKV
jgi:type IV secretory pathway VirB10-like protein